MTITKEEELLAWCHTKQIFNYVDVRQYSIDNYYLRADRTIRDFVEDGKLRRIPDEEAVLRGLRKEGRAPLAWFECI